MQSLYLVLAAIYACFVICEPESPPSPIEKPQKDQNVSVINIVRHIEREKEKKRIEQNPKPPEVDKRNRNPMQKSLLPPCPEKINGEKVCNVEDMQATVGGLMTNLPNTSCWYSKLITMDLTINIMQITMYGMFLVVGLVGNFYIFCAACFNTSLQHQSLNACLACLSVCDILTCGFFFAEDLARFQQPLHSWPLGEVWCLISTTVLNSVTPVANMSILLLFIERYYKCHNEERHKQLFSWQKMRGYLVFVWILGFLRSVVFVSKTTYRSCPLMDKSYWYRCDTDSWSLPTRAAIYSIDLLIFYIAIVVVSFVFARYLFNEIFIFAHFQKTPEDIEKNELAYMLVALASISFILVVPFRLITLTSRLANYSLDANLNIFVRFMVYINGAYKPILYAFLYRRLWTSSCCLPFLKPPQQSTEELQPYISDTESDIIGALQRQHRLARQNTTSMQLSRSVSESNTDPAEEMLQIEICEDSSINVTTSSVPFDLNRSFSQDNHYTLQPRGIQRSLSNGKREIGVPPHPMPPSEENQNTVNSIFKFLQQKNQVTQPFNKPYVVGQQPNLSEEALGTFSTFTGNPRRGRGKNGEPLRLVIPNPDNKYKRYSNPISINDGLLCKQPNPRHYYENHRVRGISLCSEEDQPPPDIPRRVRRTHGANYENMNAIKRSLQEAGEDTSSSDTGFGSDSPPGHSCSSPHRHPSSTSTDSVLPLSASSLKPLLEEKTHKPFFTFVSSNV